MKDELAVHCRVQRPDVGLYLQPFAGGNSLCSLHSAVHARNVTVK